MIFAALNEINSAFQFKKKVAAFLPFNKFKIFAVCKRKVKLFKLIFAEKVAGTGTCTMYMYMLALSIVSKMWVHVSNYNYS